MSDEITQVLKRSLLVSLLLFLIALGAAIALFLFIQVVSSDSTSSLDNMPKKEQN